MLRGVYPTIITRYGSCYINSMPYCNHIISTTFPFLINLIQNPNVLALSLNIQNTERLKGEIQNIVDADQINIQLL